MHKIIILLFVVLCGCASTPHFVDMGHEYLGAKYVSDPLGEGKLPDPDPLIRTDAFDCTTFVETVLSGGDVDTLNHIRYKNGIINFTNRNHFIETDWIPNNSNIVQNVSKNFGNTATRHVIIDKQSWFKKVHHINTDSKPVTADLEYIPYNNISTIKSDVPLIVLFIVGNCEKCDKIGTDIAVVHMGFLMPNGMLRHASSSYGRVMDTDFNQYVELRRNMKNNIGIVLLGIK